MLFKTLPAAVCLSIALLTAAPAGAATETSAVVDNYASVVEANYRAAHTAARQMQDSIKAFLETPSAETLDAARQAWITARQPYLQTEAFRFYEGPIDAPDTGPEGRINAWPLNEAFIDYVESKPDSGLINDTSTPLTLKTILGQDQISDEADVTTGWHAIEFLLWGQDLSADGPGQRPYTDYIKGKGNNDRRRAYLELVTGQLVQDLADMAGAWSLEMDKPNYRAKFVKTPDASLAKMLTALATLSGFELASERLAVPLDSSSQEDEHSCFSDTTHQDYIYDQKGIENVYFGRFEEAHGVGAHDLLTEKDPALAKRVAAAIQATSAAVAKIPAPFDRVLASKPGDASRVPVEAAMKAFETQADLLVEAGKALELKGVEILAE